MSFAVGLIVGDTFLNKLTSLEVSSSSAGGALLSYNINADGNVLAGSFSERWIKDITCVGNYEVNAVITSGALTTNPNIAGWVPMSISHSWLLSVNTGGYGDVRFTIQIRKIGTTLVLRTAFIRLTGSGLDPGVPVVPVVSAPVPLSGGGGGGAGGYIGRVVSF